MKRTIIEIDDAKCNGCGLCIPNCPEGALQVIDGKVRLVSDLFCDGLGACIGECPQGAICTVEREAEAYDEYKVMDHIVKQGENTIAAHLKHLKSHGEFKLYEIAVSYLKENKIPVPESMISDILPCGCLGTFDKKMTVKKEGGITDSVSALQQWPVQLKLLNPTAEYFDDADILVSADCVAYAYGAFHYDLLAGRKLIVFCPKLDTDIEGYVEKLAEIFRRHEIRSVTVARMGVPCCTGTVTIVEKALELAQKSIKIKVKIININGDIQK